MNFFKKKTLTKMQESYYELAKDIVELPFAFVSNIQKDFLISALYFYKMENFARVNYRTLYDLNDFMIAFNEIKMLVSKKLQDHHDKTHLFYLFQAQAEPFFEYLINNMFYTEFKQMALQARAVGINIIFFSKKPPSSDFILTMGLSDDDFPHYVLSI